MKSSVAAIAVLFSLALVQTSCSAEPAAVSDDAAISSDVHALYASDADARTLLDVVGRIEQMQTPAQFFDEFGSVRDDRNMGADMYRNVIWKFPLASIDVTLDMNVGFDYGKMSEWSGALDFGDRADVARKYFTALCRGLEHETSHVSSVKRFEHPRADTEVCAYYPISGDASGRMLEISSTDDGRHGVIFITPVPMSASKRVMVRIRSDDVKMFAFPDPTADVIRPLSPGQLIFSMETKSVDQRGKNGPSYWIRLIDGDGEIGWIRASDADEVGVFTLSNAFTKIQK